MSPFSARVDFKKLRRKKKDDSGIPTRGPLNRILVSRHEPAQGVDYSGACIASGVLDDATGCIGIYRGQLQPYAIYVPEGPVPKGGWGMTLLLHSLAASYNQYLGSRHQRQFGERGPGSIVITPEARGPDGGYLGHAAADTFEVWADVARRYKLRQSWTVTTGYSMGAIGSFRLAQEFPDLFARMQPTVGSESETHRLASLRNVPVLMWNGVVDELQGPQFYLPDAAELDRLGYRYELDQYVPGEHLSLAINDQYAPAAAFLGTDLVDRNPFHVTYVVDPALYEPKLDIVADHAYWLSEMKVRGSGHGTIDAVSHGFGEADPVVGQTQFGGGGLAGGTLLDPYPFSSQKKAWGPARSGPVQDRLEIDATNLSAATINVTRAKLSCNAQLDVNTDGPITLRLVDSAKKASKKGKGRKRAKKRKRCNRVERFG
jgi:pimeloyl-ACP methyl ester carboxylesterase